MKDIDNIILNDVLSRITDGIIAFDINWNYTYINKKAASILNKSPQELLGKNVWELFPKTVGSPFHKAYYETLRTQQYCFLEDKKNAATDFSQNNPSMHLIQN